MNAFESHSMKHLPAGAFFGDTRTVTEIGNVTLTHVDYPSGGHGAGWHYHEHAFFSLILDGRSSDITRRGAIDCPRGTLLYQPSQEPHHNKGYGGRFESFFVELGKAWFATVGQAEETLMSVRHIEDPRIRILFHQVYRESVVKLPNSELVVDGLLTRIVATLAGEISSLRSSNRLTSRITDLLRSSTGKLTLRGVARELDVHPVYLSRYFAKHFGCGFRQYMRLAHVEASLTLMHDASLSLTDIAFAAVFADQSHFVRCFKHVHGLTPSQYRHARRG